MSYYFDAIVLLTSIPSEISILSHSNISIYITHTEHHLKELVDKVYDLLQKQI